MNKYIENIIPVSDIPKWRPDEPVMISAGTGTHKTSYIYNYLGKYAKDNNKKILLLTQRTASKKQMQSDVKSKNLEGTIDVRTYQSLDHYIQGNGEIDLRVYDYIVSDESHYWISDAPFNNLLDLSFKAIIRSRAVKIFMSATVGDFERYLRLYTKWTIKKYEITRDWSFIDNLVFFTKDRQIAEIIDDFLAKGEKGIVFINNLKKSSGLYKKYRKQSLYVCSDSSNNGMMDLNKKQELLDCERFDEPILITTSALDSGVNINDDDVKNIILDIKDIDTLLQCIGRKRLKPDEKINLYIRIISDSQLDIIKNQFMDLIDEADYFLQNGKFAYLNKYCQNRDLNSRVMYLDLDGELKLNQLRYYKSKADVVRINKIIEEGGWMRYIANYLLRHCYQCRTYDDIKLSDYLNANAGRIYYTPENREELIQAVGLQDRSRRLVKGINAINGFLKDRGYGYQIYKKPATYILPDGTKKRCKAAWLLDKTH